MWIECRIDSIFFFTNLMNKFFILIHLLHSSTCFEDYCAHLQEDNCINSLNAELNPMCHLLALLGAHPILHFSGIRVNTASGIVTLETSEWSKLLKYIVCCIIWTLQEGKIHIKSI